MVKARVGGSRHKGPLSVLRHATARMKSLSRRNVDDEGGRKPGRKPAKDGPGFQVDGPRAWGWPLSMAGAEERGQAGMVATRGSGASRGGPGGAEGGAPGRERQSTRVNVS